MVLAGAIAKEMVMSEQGHPVYCDYGLISLLLPALKASSIPSGTMKN